MPLDGEYTAGSSPLTRGKPRRVNRVRRGWGLIPAHAGKTGLHYTSRAMYGAHPRSRGENDPGSTQPERLMGSSPLTRGKPEGKAAEEVRRRLIPAHAGKTLIGLFGNKLHRAHPRSRGENSIEETTGGLAAGSSPLTRGKQLLRHCCGACLRLIPAHAGKTKSVEDPHSRMWAHPRSRGENLSARSCAKPKRGSSPLTRGKLGQAQVPNLVRGLIPAHAGKTLRSRFARTSPTAHPRSRGENDALLDRRR